MKAKTIVGLMACAVLVPAFADIDNNKATTNDWFSTSVSGESVSATGAEWNTTPAVEGSTTKVMVIDADVTSPATLTPTEAKATEATKKSDGLVTITSKAYLAPSAIADQPAAATLGNAQVGFAVFTTTGETPTSSYYVYVRTGATQDASPVSTGEWIAVTGTNVTVPNGETDTEFKIVLDYRTNKASFFVKVSDAYVALSGTQSSQSTDSFTFVPVTANLSDIAALGSGTITSIDAKFEEAVAVVDNVRYGTIAEAYTAAGNSGTVAVWDPANGAPYADQTTANGLGKAVCMALNIAPDAKIALEPAAQNVENKVVLKTAVAPVDGVTALFTVSTLSGTSAGEGSYTASNIQIPLGTGTYQVIPTVGPKVTPAP